MRTAGETVAAELETALSELKSQLDRLRDRFVEEAARLEATGQVPGADFETEVRQAQDAMSSARVRLADFAASFAPTVRVPANFKSFEELRDTTNSCFRAYRDSECLTRKQLATEVLRRVLRLVPAGGGRHSDELRACLKSAGELLRKIEANDPSTKVPEGALAAGEHIFCAFLTLVQRTHDLSPAEGVEKQERVREELGGALAWAAVTGGLQVSELTGVAVPETPAPGEGANTDVLSNADHDARPAVPTTSPEDQRLRAEPPALPEPSAAPAPTSPKAIPKGGLNDRTAPPDTPAVRRGAATTATRHLLRRAVEDIVLPVDHRQLMGSARINRDIEMPSKGSLSGPSSEAATALSPQGRDHQLTERVPTLRSRGEGDELTQQVTETASDGSGMVEGSVTTVAEVGDAVRVSEPCVGEIPAAAPAATIDAVAVQPTSEAERPHTVPDEAKGSVGAVPLPREEAERALWRLLVCDRLGLAFHLARAFEAAAGSTGGGNQPTLSVRSSVIACAALGPLVRSGHEAGELKVHCDMLGEHLEELRGAAGEDAQRLLLVSASLRPALLAPATGAATLLELTAIAEPFGAVHELRRAVLDYTLLGLDLNPSVLKGVRQHAKWLQLLESQQEDCRRWVAQSQQAKIKYAPATDVLHRWLRADHELGRMLLAVKEGERGRAAEVLVAAQKWSSPRYVERQVRETDSLLRGRKADLRPIDAGALASLDKAARHAVSMVKEWLSLIASEPETMSDFRYRQADECRTKILSSLKKAELQLRQLEERRGNTPLRYAARLAKSLLDNLARLFDPDVGEAGNTELPRHVLGRELLGTAGLRMDDAWEPRLSPPSALVTRLLLSAAAEPATPAQAMTIQCEARDHVATGRILELVEASGASQDIVEPLQKVRNHELGVCRAKLGQTVEQTLRQLERAASYDVLAETHRLELLARVNAVRPEIVLLFEDAEATLVSVRGEIELQIESRVEQVRKRLASAELLTKFPQVVERVEQSLATGDFIRADEYIAAAEAGEPLPQPPALHDAFLDFFPQFLRSVHDFLENLPKGGSLRDYLDDIARGRSVGPVDMATVPGPQAESASRMLECWLRIKSRRGVLAQSVGELFECFGFRIRSADQGPSGVSGRFLWVELQTEPTSDRAECVLPQYGSGARGRYAVLCVWERPSEEELINLAARRGHDDRVVVLYLGRMTEQRRRDLAYQCRHRRRLMLVVDESVVLFLCGIRGLRMPVLMRCCLPFTVADPYTTTAGLVPEEMFFGRRLERDRIMDTSGTSLVYGGRQLGKTALLRDVERRHHYPNGGVLVKWIDLRFEGIGETRPIEDIWAVLSEALLKLGVLTHAAQRQDTLHRKIVEWLSADDRRRIVLLLDEADAFLESDSKGRQQYQNLTALKGMMDQTQRRFKVVFAGLHNVQRASRDINTPVAHLGDPICIGPLLGGGGEAREAASLITVPIEALGYRFDPPDLPLRILSHTNYYPSLIQLFCKELLDHLTHAGDTLFDPRGTPPYIITAQHLEDAYQSQKLRQAILHRFNLTLDLDPRYRAVALSIALETQEGIAKGRAVPGFSVQSIRDQMLSWWPAGFRADNTLEAFQNILDEMIGLGVLRRVGDTGLYSLRSPNVLNLLGTKAEVDDALLAVLDTAPPPSYEPATFRRAQPGDPWVRSPLTAQQESALLRKSNVVTLIFGSRLAGLERTAEFLAICAREFGQEVQLQRVEAFADIAAFRCELEDAKAAASRGLTLLVVPPECAWDENWVRAAQRAAAGRKSKVSFLKVVLIGDPKAAWWWCDERDATESAVGESVEVHSLRPWAEALVHRWMNDTDFGQLTEAARTRVSAVTGRWDQLLNGLADRCRHSPQSWERHLDELSGGVLKLAPDWARHELVTPAVPVLRALADIQPATSEDLRDWLASADTIDRAGRADRVLRWADLLQFASRNADGLWVVDPVIAQLM